MSRRIRTTRQARACRRLAEIQAVHIEWLAMLQSTVPELLYLWSDKNASYIRAQAYLDKRAEMKRGDS